ncbi:hypothetical protein HHK36_015821 [Tetracentron sinense]|uniref:Uncharacterized protein n=1 Tax=Tetracentron sinense TaxID=13715 RepID=A0A835DH66_TETSI|nr:hypothetical protein HHK36_015821 [Tetracentron sinense]
MLAEVEQLSPPDARLKVSNEMFGPDVTYCTVPSKVQPGMVLFSFNSTNGEADSDGMFSGGDSKSGFCNRSVGEDSFVIFRNSLC